MSLRTALSQARWLTFAVLLVGLWVLLNVIQVATQFNWNAVLGSEYVGHAAPSGVVGVLMLLVTLGLLVMLYSELTESGPLPGTWPPK